MPSKCCIPVTVRGQRDNVCSHLLQTAAGKVSAVKHSRFTGIVIGKRAQFVDTDAAIIAQKYPPCYVLQKQEMD